MSTPRSSAARLAVVVFVAVLIVGAAVVMVRMRQRAGLPPAGSSAYEETSRQFYRGLAEMQVGLLDVAVESFSRATATAPGEPAAWANLGLADLRLGEFDRAAPALDRAASLAPRNSAVAFLQARLASARGQREAAVERLRRAVDLDAANPRARTALAEEIESGGGSAADDEAQRVLESLVAAEGGNTAVLVERARLAAKRGDASLLRDSMQRLGTLAPGWPAEVQTQFRAADEASRAGDAAGAAREIAFLRNTLASVPAFREGRARVMASAELIADPFTTFLRLTPASPVPAPPDTSLAYTPAPWTAVPPDVTAIEAAPLDGEGAPVVLGRSPAGISRIDAAGPPLTLADPPRPDQGLAVFDWDNDFRMDVLAGTARGVRLFLQRADGTFADATTAASGGRADDGDVTGIWAADVDMDGDLDAVVARRGAAPFVLRNNGDGTWLRTEPFAGVGAIAAFAWGDVDGDADPDVVMLGTAGDLHVLANQQAGRFAEMAGPQTRAGVRGVVVGDADGDGVMEIVTVDRQGAIRRARFDAGGWRETAAGRIDASEGAVRLFLADLDNNGALDLVVASGGTDGAGGLVGVRGTSGAASTTTAAGRSTVFLADERHAWTTLPAPVPADVRAVVDLDGDGVLDLVGLDNGRAVRFSGHGTRGYHYQVVEPRAQAAAGDQRINSFGVGGTVQTRSGLLVQTQIIAGPRVHVGLGTRTRVDVARIVWPNGVLQADFDLAADQAVVAQQRLKGSCPWVFADNGTGFGFVTDFLWRSPLGLRINAQDTAGVTQTEDRVRIRGDQLVARDGRYDLRITAELWETHFVDHVSLLAVDHPADVDVFVDERFARTAPALDVHAVRAPQTPIAGAWDEAGRDVTDRVRDADGRYLDTFARGRYQGVAADHFVEIELAAPIPRGRRTWLVGQGWIYPTDSSINVAIGQGHAVVPRGLSLEALDARGRWVTVDGDLGFPAGKNKTILIDLSRVEQAGVPGARRLRLRTNLEVYWDRLATAEDASTAPVVQTRLPAASAVLRYRGFSVTRAASRTSPELPVYAAIANTAPRWRDLIGFYTRFGDVRELLGGVDDRYVIMNAGDELALSFAAPPRTPGTTRDFVLIGDGWVKDGDYNTTASKTVGPLPVHGRPDYADAAGPGPDPVAARYPDDWRTFHTRFVAPDAFTGGAR